MSLKDDFQGDEDIIFDIDEMANTCVYTRDPAGDNEQINTQVVRNEFDALVDGPGGQKEAAVFLVRRSIFAAGQKPKYKDTIVISTEMWTVERIIDSGKLSYTVEARKGERGKY